MKRVALRDVAEFVNGRAFKPEDWGTQGYPIIRIQNLTGSNDVVNYYNGEFDQKHLITKNDILISWSASLGVYVWHGKDSILNQHIFKVSPKRGVDRNYFYFAALSVLDHMKSQVHGATMQHITKDPFESTEIPLPPLPEQQRIAALLSKADRLQRLRRYALEMSEGYLQAVFVQMFGDPVTNPMGWDFVELEEFLNFLTSGPRGWAEYYSNTGARFIRSFDVQMNFISETDKMFVNAPHNAEAKRTIVRPHDVLLTITGSKIGRVSAVPESIEEAYVSQHVAILRLKDTIDPQYLSMYLSLDRGGQRQIEQLQYGQTKPGLSLDNIREFAVLYPPLQRQKQFVEVMHKHERLRHQQREALRQAEHLFQTLLARAFEYAGRG